MFAAGPSFHNIEAPKHSLSVVDSRAPIKRMAKYYARFELFEHRLDAVHLMKEYFQTNSLPRMHSLGRGRSVATVPSETRGPFPAQDSTLQRGGKGTSGSSEAVVAETAGHAMFVAVYVNISMLTRLKGMAAWAAHSWAPSPLVARDSRLSP